MATSARRAVAIEQRSAREDSLAEYNRKRDFRKTAEPMGRAAVARGRALRFVIQKHRASHLHYDLRLELDGAMKSWAVPKGPSRDPAVKRFARHVEDHPIAYNKFEGTIPAGEYGAGDVIIWDRGTYTPGNGDVDAFRAGLAKGKVSFTLHGERLKGTWHLVKMHRQDANWLLLKERDEFAEEDDRLAEEENRSVASKRVLDVRRDRAGSKEATPPSRAKRARAAPAATRSPAAETEPPRIRGRKKTTAVLTPMLASVGTDLPGDQGWIFEPKYDGVRVLAFVDGADVMLVTRNEIDRARQFPEIVESLRELGSERRRSFVIDGEVVARDKRQLGRFQALQGRIAETDPETIAANRRDRPVVLVAFDVLMDGSEILAQLPLVDRRARLERLIGRKKRAGLQLGEAFHGASERLIERAREQRWEGVMAKRADSVYEPGVRTENWLKFKLELRQEFVIGGWTEPRKSRKHFGALLLGYYDGNRLVYAGHTGTGFTHEGLAELMKAMRPLARKTSPFTTEPDTNELAHWLKPELVAEIKFNQWTNEGVLRQPVFVGLRYDKDAREVTREPLGMQEKTSARGAARDGQARRSAAKSAARTKSTRAGSLRPTGESKRVAAQGQRRRFASPRRAGKLDPVVAQLADIEASGGDGIVTIGRGRSLDVSNLDKTYFPAVGRTKGDVMRYYAQVASYLVPILADRPLVLQRFPNGIDERPFFQQNAPADVPAGVRVEDVPTDDGAASRLVGGDIVTLLYAAQLGTITMNPWHSRIDHLAYSDYTVLDLDPGPTTKFAALVSVAKWVKELLDESGLTGVLKTSGSRGLHVFIPLPPRTSNESALLVAQLLAERVATEHPAQATTTRARSDRASSAVYVDYLQNILGKSVASAFSVRPKERATVSTPLSWDELGRGLDPAAFTIDTVPGELENRGKLWVEGMRAKNRLQQLLKPASSGAKRRK
jgi:bifunctional non-homologous end joining protein LigD